MVRLDCPVLLTEVEIVRLLPTWTLPKLRLEAAEGEQQRTNCPATAIEHQTILSRINLGQERLRRKPKELFIVPPLMSVLMHGRGYGATALRLGPPRLGDELTQGTVSSCSRSSPNRGRSQKVMWEYTIGTYVARSESPSAKEERQVAGESNGVY